jgi:hypothetical protein
MNEAKQASAGAGASSLLSACLGCDEPDASCACLGGPFSASVEAPQPAASGFRSSASTPGGVDDDALCGFVWGGLDDGAA